eukprot:3457994-Amphidinium_carterae.1
MQLQPFSRLAQAHCPTAQVRLGANMYLSDAPTSFPAERPKLHNTSVYQETGVKFLRTRA